MKLCTFPVDCTQTMEELDIYKFQAKHIENTLRIVANVMDSREKATCLDRDICKSIEYIKEVLAKSKS